MAPTPARHRLSRDVLPPRLLPAVWLVALTIALGDCSSDPQPAVAPTPTTGSTATVWSSAPDSAPHSSLPESGDVPTRGQAGDPVDGGNWLGHGEMTETRVELIWSEVEGQDINYRLYRVETEGGVDPEGLDLGGPHSVYSGPGVGFVDETVQPNTFYTYLPEADVDGTALSRRWTTALTVTDHEPPSPVTGLRAGTNPDGVLLRWDPSTDNVEFAPYAVSLLVDGELRYLGGRSDPSQISFLDNRPETGPNVRVVQAVDFHDNRTEGARIEITVG